MNVTVYDICKQIPTLGEDGKFAIGRVRRGEKIESVVHGRVPKRAPAVEGLHDFTPEELLSLRVPVVSVNSRVSGYQRPFDRNHARKIALAIMEGKPMPAGEVALDGHGNMETVDCQHRVVGHVIADAPFSAVVTRRSKEERRELFAGQRKAKPVDRNVLIVAGSGPYEIYIQDALTDDKHPWGQIVSANSRSRTRISPHQMLQLLGRYVGNSASTMLSRQMEERWDDDRADEMAPLVSCFGDKQTNPPAFRAPALQGIGTAAMFVFRRNDAVQTGDYERWVMHMSKFPWDRHLHVRTAADFAFHLVNHWNKRIHEARKVSL